MPMNAKRQEIDLSAVLHGASWKAASSGTDQDTAATAVDTHNDFCEAVRIVDSHCQLGECVIYDDRSKAVLWTDILLSEFHKLQLNDDTADKIVHTTYGPLPKMLGAFGLVDSSNDTESLPLLCAWEDGFQLYDLETGTELSAMSEGEDVNPKKGDTRLNDGRTDRQGKRFVCGGFHGDKPEFYEKVFSVAQQEDGKLVHAPIVDKIQVTNSICWNLDGSRMFLGDSPAQTIWTYAYDFETGKLSDKKVLNVKQKDEKQTFVPDGSCVDAEGFLWNAVWNYGDAPSTVQRIDPSSGKVVYTVHMPDHTSQVSCCCFGGDNMDILFITSAACNREAEKQPHAGALYAAKVPFKGVKESRLKFRVAKSAEDSAEAEVSKRPRLGSID